MVHPVVAVTAGWTATGVDRRAVRPGGSGLSSRTVLLIAMGGTTTAGFALFPGSYALLVVLSVLAGAVRGNLTLLQATALTDRWGTTHYGRLSGLLAAPATTAAALAPLAGAALVGPLGGYPTLFLALAGTSAIAATIAGTSRPEAPARDPDEPWQHGEGKVTAAA